MLATLAPHLLNGIALGLLFALLALGFMLIVGLMETINLAHGSFFALGAYIALMIIAPPLPPDSAAAWLSLPVAWRWHDCLVAGAGNRRCARHGARARVAPDVRQGPLYALLLTFGAAIVIEEQCVPFGVRASALPVPEALWSGRAG